MAFHAPVVAFLTVSVLLTEDRALTWTRLSEFLLWLAGLPLSFVATSILAFAPTGEDWMLDAVTIAVAWINVVVVAVLTRRGWQARPLVEAAGMVAAGVGIWAVFLSWAVEAAYGFLPSAAAALAVLATVAALSSRRPPVLVGCCVGGGAYLAVCAHAALNAALWIFLAVPLAVIGGGAVALVAWAGSRPHERPRQRDGPDTRVGP